MKDNYQSRYLFEEEFEFHFKSSSKIFVERCPINKVLSGFSKSEYSNKSDKLEPIYCFELEGDKCRYSCHEIKNKWALKNIMPNNFIEFCDQINIFNVKCEEAYKYVKHKYYVNNFIQNFILKSKVETKHQNGFTNLSKR